VLRAFAQPDSAPFAALNAQPLIVEWLGGARTRAESDALAETINSEIERRLDPAHWSKGYATEVAEASLHHGTAPCGTTCSTGPGPLSQRARRFEA
jgi:RimJ/RimL family protein N-acetyltransferase